MAQGTPLHRAEFHPITQRHQVPIGDYRDHLCTLYTQHDMQHLELDHWKMTELRICRNEKHTQLKYEYLIATFTDSAKGKVHLRMDRQIQHPSSPPPDTDNNEQNGPQLMQLGARVIDSVSLYPDHDLKGACTAEHITFHEGHRISLPKFIFLACAVRECSRAYPLRRANYYWFCLAMMAALKASYPEHHLLPVQVKKQRTAWHVLLCGSVDIDELLARTEQMWSHLGQLQIQANVD